MKPLTDQTFCVTRTKVLEALRKNREVHKEDYMRACQGYYERLKEHLVAVTAWFGEVVPPVEREEQPTQGEMLGWFALPNGKQFESPPANHLSDYDEPLQILGSIQTQDVTLTGAEISAYMHDRWLWSPSFRAAVKRFKE